MTSSDDNEKIDALKTNIGKLDKQRRKKTSLKSIFSSITGMGDDHSLLVSLLSKLIRSSVDAVIAADKKGNLLIFNEMAESLFGYTEEHALSTVNIRALYPEGAAYEIMERLRSREFGGVGKLSGGFAEVVNRDGKRLPVRINASIVYDDEEEIATIGYLRNLLDIPREKETTPGISDHGIPATEDASLNDFLANVTEQLKLYDKKFCIEVIKNKIASLPQVKQSLKKQKEILEKTKVHVPIGRVMIQMGMISEVQRNAILNLHRMDVEKGASSSLESPPVASAPSLDDMIRLKVSDDQLQADIFVEPAYRDQVTPRHIIQRLNSAGITFGIAETAAIESYLQSKKKSEEPLIAAKGRPSLPGNPTEIRYAYEPNALKVGTVREDGSIDWKNRGKLPQVKTGEILAEIVPATEGSAGMDVFGKEIQPPETSSEKIKCGKGVEISDDGLQCLAKSSGLVSVSEDLTFSIIETLVIEGDVGMKTGHVDFNGHVEVSGSVSGGYRVNCRSLRADDVREAEISAAGDIVVMSGIYNSEIKCKGCLRASHIHHSKIRTGGDILVEKEIMDSEVECSGKCVMNEGTLIHSEIKTRNGITAKNIGTKGSKPCTLVVGVDPQADKEIQFAKRNIKLHQKEISEIPNDVKMLETKKSRLETAAGELEKQIGNIRKELDIKHRKNNASGDGSGKKETEKNQEEIKVLNVEKEECESRLEKTKFDLDAVLSRIRQANEELENGQVKLAELEKELAALTANRDRFKKSAVVQVLGCVFEGTTITGPHATLTVNDHFSESIIKEEKGSDPDNPNAWIMRIRALDRDS